MSKGPVIAITLTADDKTGRGFKSAEVNASGFGSKVSGAAIALGSFAGNIAAQALPAAIDFGKELFSVGQSAEQMGRKADTVFGEQSGSVKRWADTVNESLGMSDEAVVGLAANMGDLLVPMGFTRDAAADLSTETLDAAGALSAWSSGAYDTADVSDRLTKAMLGELDGLKALGISISAAERDERALAIARREGRDEITAMDQALATQELILEKSTDAQNAWSDGTMDAVKSQNELKAMVEDAKVSIGRRLVPAIQGAVKWIIKDFVPAVQRIVAKFREDWPRIRAAVEPTLIWFRDTVRDVLAIVSDLWNTYGGAIVRFATDTFNNLRQVIGGAMEFIRGLVDLVLGILTGDWSRAWDGIKSIVRGALRIVTGVIRQGMNALRLIIDLAWTTIKTLSRKAWEWVLDRIKSIWGSIKTTVSGAIDSVVGYVKGLPARISATISGLWGGLKTKTTEARDWVRDRINNVVGYVTGLPARISATISGLWGGLKTKTTEAKDWVRDRINDVVGYVTGLPGRMPSFAGMFDGIKDAFRSAINWIIRKWNGLDFEFPGFPGLGGGFTVGTPNIPELAQGGVIRRRPGGIIARLGEGAYDEAVIPLRSDLALGGGDTIHNYWPAGVRPDDVRGADRTWYRRNAADLSPVGAH